MSYTNVAHCGNEHTDWLNAIEFYKQDLDILQKRLAEVASKNNGREAMAGVEHFQNQFIVQRNNIDILRHNINEHAGKVFADAKEHAGKIENVLIGEHDQMKDEFNSFEKVVKDLREEFNQFLVKWM